MQVSWRRIGTTKALSCAWMASKKEVSAVVVKAFKSFQMFPVPVEESEQSCGGPGAGGFWMAAIYTHTPGEKPAPGFTFGIARLLL